MNKKTYLYILESLIFSATTVGVISTANMTECSSTNISPQSKTENEQIHHSISTQIKHTDKHESTLTDNHAAANYQVKPRRIGRHDVRHQSKAGNIVTSISTIRVHKPCLSQIQCPALSPPSPLNPTLDLLSFSKVILTTAMVSSFIVSWQLIEPRNLTTHMPPGKPM